MTQMQDLRKKTDTELAESIKTARTAIHAERFKDAFSRKPKVIQTAKKEVARALTELTTRRRNPETK